MKYQDLKSHVEMISYAAVQPGHHMDYVRDTVWILGNEIQKSPNYESFF